MNDQREHVVALVVWLEWPFCGRACYIVERGDKVGLLPATVYSGTGESRFIPLSDKRVVQKALRLIKGGSAPRGAAKDRQ